MRGATCVARLTIYFALFQSTLLMRGATAVLLIAAPAVSISIHAPHARSDSSVRRIAHAAMNFNPRSSCEERHYPQGTYSVSTGFQSTLLMRGATARSLLPRLSADFNPRSSCEERRAVERHGQRYADISIHAPHARSDSIVARLSRPKSINF